MMTSEKSHGLYSSRKLDLLYEGCRVLAFARGLQSSRNSIQ